jgi:hypothetical protein
LTNSQRFQPWVRRTIIPRPAGAAEKIARKIIPSLRNLVVLFLFYPQLKLRAIFSRRFAAGNNKGVLADAFAILFEEFSRHALSPT